MRLAEPKTENFLSFKKFVPGKGCGLVWVICYNINMKKISKSFLNWIKSHKIWAIIIIIVLLALGWYFLGRNSSNTKYTEIPVTVSSISEIVSVTGNVKPLATVDLAFERGGRVANINVAVGDKVYTGQSLTSVSNADLVASLDQAKANLKITELQSGNKLDQATLNLAQDKISLVNSIKDSYTQADDAVRNKIYSLFTDPNRYQAKLSFTTDSYLRDSIESGKDTISDSLSSWYSTLSSINTNSDLDVYYNTAKTNLLAIKSLLDKCATAVNGLSPGSSNISYLQIDAWKSNMSLARTSINQEINSLVGIYDQYQAALLALVNTKNDFSVQQVTVEQARAGVASAEAELAKSIIRAPINGVVTNIVPKLGETVSAGQTVISVISYGDYEVEAFVPEADISKVKIGNFASTTLDAYGSGVNFQTTVIKIDPAATLIDGVPTYKVTFKFITQDERVKSGMTANLDILTNHKDNVLVLPGRLVVTKDDGKYVSVADSINPGKSQDKKIVTGLRGVDGNVEIVSGLSEGEKVVVPTL